ncbi:hypothetical protein D1J36_002215 [Riemerella anatipestifer]|uniref:hypothetical protein n=1 Tax=Riemerella anatipestifer TaxID=34085 RepID=UPI0012AE4E34|nr:hypothetical protein [Riemerella anatipestifer]MDY3362444.1 hypothetical protein [Riemerella anatipestifer]USL95944.1 hypothetical protein D1J36_002215 [Riemerella anatipestifer]
MFKNLLPLVFTIFLLVSCSVEQVNLSPLSQGIVSKGEAKTSPDTIVMSASVNVSQVKYASELSTAADKLPRFSDAAINKHIDLIKFNVSEYLYALREHNENRKVRTLDGLQKSYKKLQGLRKNLSLEEDEALNFYLVKIKTNITMLESIKTSSDNF